MSVASMWVVSPNSEVPSCFGFLESTREGNRPLDSSRSITRDSRRFKKAKYQSCNSSCSLNSGSCRSSSSRERRPGKFSVLSALMANPAGEIAVSSEQKVYHVVLKQAALVKEQLRAKGGVSEAMPEMVLPGTLSLLSEAYDRCGEVCAEYAKTFYLGTLLMTPERRRAIWAIYVWCRRTDELVDGPNASHITPSALDRWESRLEDVFRGRPFDMLDAALSDTEEIEIQKL